MKYNTRTCRKCGAESLIKDSRLQPDGLIRRRRQCKVCAYRWSTLEIPEGSIKIK